MPINSTHPSFNTNQSTVSNDAFNGNVLDYVPKLKGQNSNEYDDYRQRGVYFNATKKTVESMIGAILRKPFTTDMEDVTIDGKLNLHEFVATSLKDIILCGRTGILCDYNEAAGTPYLTSYNHNNIINWRDDMSLIVLSELTFEDDPNDAYELKEIQKYRELFIDDEGYYNVRVWTESGKGTFVISEEYQPTIRGERLSFIPFTFVTPYDTSTIVQEPIVINLAQINISHFKSIVDVEHGVHFTALPTPVIMGDFAQDVEGEISIGSTTPWHLEEGASATYLEFTGSGLKSLEDRINSKEEQMASIGSKLLTERKGVESAESLRIRSGAESSTLVSLVNAMESGMRQSLAIYSLWNGDSGEVEFEMSRDFTGGSLSPQEMTALMQLYMNGVISQETFLENLYEGEITNDVEIEMERLSSVKNPDLSKNVQ